MIEIRVTKNDADLSGTAAELQGIRAAILGLLSSPERTLVVPAQAGADPMPYDRCLRELRVVRGAGPSRVQVQDSEILVITGADQNLDGFASWFNVSPDAAPGTHGHFEYFEGNECIAPDSVPLVVGVLR